MPHNGKERRGKERRRRRQPKKRFFNKKDIQFYLIAMVLCAFVAAAFSLFTAKAPEVAQKVETDVIRSKVESITGQKMDDKTIQELKKKYLSKGK